MKRDSRLAALAGLVLLGSGLLFASLSDVQASPVGLTTLPVGSQVVGQTFRVSYTVTDDSPQASLSWNSAVAAYVGIANPGDATFTGDVTCTPDFAAPPPALVYSVACLGAIDADGAAEIVTTTATFQCTAPGPVVFTLSQAPGPDLTASFVCVTAPTPTPTPPPSGGGGGGGGGGGFVADSCDDFTEQRPRDWCNGLITGNSLDCEDFPTSDEATAFTRFADPTDINNLDADNDGISCEDELPSQAEARCALLLDVHDPLGCSVVVTANPNVVFCHGTSTITASVRNRAGHALPGFGFHFITDVGLLTVVPNQASTEVATATLQLFPGMGSATVIVSVGINQPGTIEQEVLGHTTVQNFCPSYTTTASTIALSASSPTVACAGRVFIAARLKDTLGNPVPDGTEITFLASQGSVKDEFVSTSGTPTPGGSSPSVKVPTRGGVANIIYTADGGAAGIVTITAASGAAFGSIDLSVCPSGTAGVGVRPPNTGARITPPSTGDAGLAE